MHLQNTYNLLYIISEQRKLFKIFILELCKHIFLQMITYYFLFTIVQINTSSKSAVDSSLD